jgi:uncharacterized protein
MALKEIKIKLPERAIADFCIKWEIREMALFGSVLRDDFGPESDIDILVTVKEGSKRTLFDLVRMKNEMSEILGREVDIVSRRGISKGRNALRRDAILNTAEAIYVA